MATEPRVQERRRGERVLIRIPIKVYAIGKDGKHVNEPGETVVVSRYGALLRTSTALKPGSQLELMNNFTQEVEKFRVIWVSERPKEGHFDVGVEILAPRDDFWGIRFPQKPQR